MALIDINLLNLGGVNIGANVTGVLAPGLPKDQAATSLQSGQVSATELSIPFRSLTANPDTLSYLSWHTALSEFAGRDDELDALNVWANTGPKISIKFLTGDGGVGKSRLAAEFGKQLRSNGWAAGLAKPQSSDAYLTHVAGTLLIIDYPEEHRSDVKTFLDDLARTESAHPIRILFLSRSPLEDWLPLVEEARAVDLLDTEPVHLRALSGTPAYKVFTSTLESASEAVGSTPLPLSEEALLAWLEQAPENAKALFIVAAAVHGALNPTDEVVHYSGRDVVVSLVRRELQRLGQARRPAI
jgi:hypothetical protein